MSEVWWVCIIIVCNKKSFGISKKMSMYLSKWLSNNSAYSKDNVMRLMPATVRIKRLIVFFVAFIAKALEQ